MTACVNDTQRFGYMSTRRRTWTFAWLGLAAVVIAAFLIAVGPVRKIGEFGRAEAVKGYWASLQDFEKQNGRYPIDNAEIAAFFHTKPGSEPVEYVSPQQAGRDDVVLWWKQKTLFGVQVGITKSGTVVKR
jgi:hypothetical protein